MAARDLVFNFTGDPSGVAQATEDVKKRLQELLDAELEQARVTTQLYEEMTRAQQEEFRKRFQSEEDLQKGVQELQRARTDAEANALDEYTRRSREAFGEVEAAAEDSARTVGDSTEKGFDKASDSASKLSGTVSGELSGAMRGFDGTAQGALNSVVDGLSGLAALAPGVGALIGAGIGVAGTQMVRSFFDGADESEGRIERMYDAFLESGSSYITRKQAQDLAIAALDDETMVKRAKIIAESFQIPFEQALGIIATNTSEAKSMLDEVEEKFQSSDGWNDMSQEVALGWVATREALRDTVAEIDETVGSVETVRRVLSFLPEGVNETTDAAIDANAEMDRLANPRTTRVTVEVDTTAADRAVERFRARASRDITGEFYVTQNGRVIK